MKLSNLIPEIQITKVIRITDKGKELMKDYTTLYDLLKKYNLPKRDIGEAQINTDSWLLEIMGFGNKSHMTKEEILSNIRKIDTDPDFINDTLNSLKELKSDGYIR